MARRIGAALAVLAACAHGARAMRMPTQLATRLVFEPPARPARVARKHVVVGTADALRSSAAKSLLPLGLPFSRWRYLVDVAAGGAGHDGASTTWMFTADDGRPSTIVAAVLPEQCSRHSSPVRPHAVTALLRGTKADADVLVVLDAAAHAGGTACAIGRAFPTCSFKSSAAADAPPTVRVSFATRDGPLEGGYASAAAAAAAVRRAARLVDLPPAMLTTTAFVGEARLVAERLSEAACDVSCEVLSGEALADAGYGLLHAVGRAAEEPPALVVLSAVPAGTPRRAVAFVGKGCAAPPSPRHAAPRRAAPRSRSHDALARAASRTTRAASR
jgi:probable aminopeptidase NPEPL1